MRATPLPHPPILPLAPLENTLLPLGCLASAYLIEPVLLAPVRCQSTCDEKVLNGAGFNVCIFAYGQSGTGKTFTMEGNDEHPGLSFRSVARLFEVIAGRKDQCPTEVTTPLQPQAPLSEYRMDEVRALCGQVYLSMLEIYNEEIRDLLNEDQKSAKTAKMEILRDATIGMYVKDLTQVLVHTSSHVKKMIAVCSSSHWLTILLAPD